MPGRHRHQITEAITGRRVGLIAAQLEREAQAAESGDIDRAAGQKAKQATDEAWPPKQEGEEA